MFMLTPLVLRSPSVRAGKQYTKVNRACGPARYSSILQPHSILDSKVFCRQLGVVQYHHSILHYRHHPLCLGVTSTLTPGPPNTPFFWQESIPPRLTESLAQQGLLLLLTHTLSLILKSYANYSKLSNNNHFILHHRHHLPWLGVRSTLTPWVLRNLSILGEK